MAQFKIRCEKNFTTIHNSIFKDKTISLKAKGLLAFMMSVPPDWDYSLAGLAACNKDGLVSVRSALQELEDNFYVKLTKVRNEKGQIVDMQYDVSDEPVFGNRIEEKPFLENPKADNPKTEKPLSENRTQLNTNTLNTKELNTKVIKDIVQEQEEPIPYAEIITYFNEVAGTHYLLRGREIKRFIKARWNEGFRLDDFKTVLDKKTAQWKNDAKMSKYLRFETLFSNKFESYLNEVVAFNKPSWNPMNPSGSRYTEEELDNLKLPF